MKINFRHSARQHTQSAKELMATGDDNLLLLAILRLRMAIECLAYELLQSLQDEVDDDTMETWQPGRLIRELKEIDSGIEQDRSISVGVENVQGDTAKEMRSLGTDIRLTAPWINKHWNALGSYLHEPTIKQQKEGKSFNAYSALLLIADVSSEIERVLASTLFATVFKVEVSKTCECGFKMVRREELLRRDGLIVCANCKTIWGANESEKVWEFVRQFHTFPCPKCKAINHIPAKEIHEDSQLNCADCDAKLVSFLHWCVRTKD